MNDSSLEAHIQKLQKWDVCKTKQCTTKVSLTAGVESSGVCNQDKEISTLLMRKSSLQHYNMLSLVAVQVKKHQVKERIFEKKGTTVIGNSYSSNILQKLTAHQSQGEQKTKTDLKLQYFLHYPPSVLLIGLGQVGTPTCLPTFNSVV